MFLFQKFTAAFYLLKSCFYGEYLPNFKVDVVNFKAYEENFRSRPWNGKYRLGFG